MTALTVGTVPPNPFVRSAVYRELRGLWSIDCGALEADAEDAHRKAVLLYPFADAELLAKGHRLTAVSMEGVGCGLAGLVPGVLLIRATADAAQWNLRVLHELAHAILRKRYPDAHTHADCWALTLMLACPRSAFRHIALADHVPSWSMDLRRMTACVVSRVA